MADEIRRLSDDLARDPSSLVFLPLADALRRTGQLDVAMRVALRGLDRHPYLADAHDVLARIHADRGDVERAADEWEMALRLDPSHAQASLGLGFVDFRRGDFESAERRLSAAAADGENPAVAAALAHVRVALGSQSVIAVMDSPPVLQAVTVTEPPAPTTERADAIVAQLESDAGITRAQVRTPPVSIPEYPAPDLSRSRQLFTSALEGPEQSALLVDADGL